MTQHQYLTKNNRAYLTNCLYILTFVAFYSFALPSITSSTAHAQSCWSVLIYDNNGRIISSGDCSQIPGDDIDRSQAPSEEQAKKNNGKAIEKGQLLMLDPPGGASTKLGRMGFKVSSKIVMQTLDTTIWVLEIPPSSNILDSLKNIRKEFPGVVIDTNDFLNLSASESVDYSRKSIGWGNVPLSCGEGLKIGMIDGGVDISHNALKGQKLLYKNFINRDRKAVAFDHGTAVAAMLIGKQVSSKISIGLLPGAELYAAGIFEQRNGKEVGNLASFFRAIEWMAFNKVPVVNLSISGGLNNIMKTVIARANTTGLIMVAAAGNNGPFAPPAWPAAHESVVAVTAIDKKRKIYAWANQGEYIDFAAPGVNLPTFTKNGLKIQSGTSYAAPFITAAVGLHLLAGFPPDIKKIKASMIKHSKDLSGKGHDKKYGYGLVRLKAGCK